MIKLIKLFFVPVVASISFAYAINPTYTDTQTNADYTLEQTCKVKNNGDGDDFPKSDYSATMKRGNAVVLTASYDVAVGTNCQNHFKDINDNFFKTKM